MNSKFLEAIPEFVSRLVIGSVFIESGWGKFQDLDRVISYFDSLSIPAAHLQAPFVAGVELIGGLFILIGLFTRATSVPLIAIMMVAIRTAKWEDVTDFSSLTSLPEFLYIALMLWLLGRGSKQFAMDVYVCRFMSRGACSLT